MAAALKGCFVAGTDTGVGKTVVSVGLLRGLRELGVDLVGMKPVASGCRLTPEGLRNDDALALQRAGPAAVAYSDVNPYAFEPPIAPHIAAADAGVDILVEDIFARAHRLARGFDGLVVEGVGGWLVPLSERATMADLARILELPVVLVVGMRLGCLNHALLSAQSIRACGCRMAGWVANGVDPDCARLHDNIAALKERLPAPLLGAVPHLDDVVSAAGLIGYLDTDLLRGLIGRPYGAP